MIAVACHWCGAPATLVRVEDGKPSCNTLNHNFLPGAGGLYGSLTVWDVRLWEFALDVVVDTPEAAAFRLRAPGHGEMESIRIAMLPGGYTAIYGDNAPGRTKKDNWGVLSRRARSDRDWFIRAPEGDYLLQEFLERVFLVDRAKEVCREIEESGRLDGAHLRELKELVEGLERIESPDDAVFWLHQLYDLTSESEDLDACYGYDPDNAAMLTAIQRRLRWLYVSLVGGVS